MHISFIYLSKLNSLIIAITYKFNIFIGILLTFLSNYFYIIQRNAKTI